MQDETTLAGLQVAGWRGGAALSDRKTELRTLANDGACVAGGVYRLLSLENWANF